MDEGNPTTNVTGMARISSQEDGILTISQTAEGNNLQIKSKEGEDAATNLEVTSDDEWRFFDALENFADLDQPARPSSGVTKSRLSFLRSAGGSSRPPSSRRSSGWRNGMRHWIVSGRSGRKKNVKGNSAGGTAATLRVGLSGSARVLTKMRNFRGATQRNTLVEDTSNFGNEENYDIQGILQNVTDHNTTEYKQTSLASQLDSGGNNSRCALIGKPDSINGPITSMKTTPKVPISRRRQYHASNFWKRSNPSPVSLSSTALLCHGKDEFGSGVTGQTDIRIGDGTGEAGGSPSNAFVLIKDLDSGRMCRLPLEHLTSVRQEFLDMFNPHSLSHMGLQQRLQKDANNHVLPTSIKMTENKDRSEKIDGVEETTSIDKDDNLIAGSTVRKFVKQNNGTLVANAGIAKTSSSSSAVPTEKHFFANKIDNLQSRVFSSLIRRPKGKTSDQSDSNTRGSGSSTSLMLKSKSLLSPSADTTTAGKSASLRRSASHHLPQVSSVLGKGQPAVFVNLNDTTHINSNVHCKKCSPGDTFNSITIETPIATNLVVYDANLVPNPNTAIGSGDKEIATTAAAAGVSVSVLHAANATTTEGSSINTLADSTTITAPTSSFTQVDEISNIENSTSTTTVAFGAAGTSTPTRWHKSGHISAARILASGLHHKQKENTKEVPCRINVKPAYGRRCGVKILPNLWLLKELNLDLIVPIWSIEVSPDGKYIAAGCQDGVVRVWGPLDGSEVAGEATGKSTKAASRYVFSSQPNVVLCGHKATIVSIQWEQGKANSRLLSTSLDKTVRIWQPQVTSDCLTVLECPDCPTSGCFHPKFKRTIYTGCLDASLQIWNLRRLHGTSQKTPLSPLSSCSLSKTDSKNRRPPREPTTNSATSRRRGRRHSRRKLGANLLPHKEYVGEISESFRATDLITAVGISGDGSVLAIGSRFGRVSFYEAASLRFLSEIDCKNRKGKTRSGRKVTGLRWARNGNLVCVTTNDSRIRILRIDDFSATLKFKGHVNDQLMLQACFTPRERHLICGSENGKVCSWEIGAMNTNKKLSEDSDNKRLARVGGRLPTNKLVESFKAFDDILTACTVAPACFHEMVVAAIDNEEGETSACRKLGFGTASISHGKESSSSDHGLKPPFQTENGEEKWEDFGDAMVFVTASFRGKIRIFLNAGGSPPGK